MSLYIFISVIIQLMYIFSKLIGIISSLISSLFDKNTKEYINYIKITWKVIFEKNLEILAEYRLCYFKNLKNFRKFIKIFKKIIDKLLLNTYQINIKVLTDVKFMYLNILKRNLVWLAIKKIGDFQKKKNFYALYRIQYFYRIKCGICSNVVLIYNFAYLRDFFFNTCKRKMDKEYNCIYFNKSLVVINHFCIFCKLKINSHHEFHLLSIPLIWNNSIFTSFESVLLVFCIRILLFLTSFRNKLVDDKKSFSKIFNNKYVYLLFFKNHCFKLLNFTLSDKRIFSSS